MSELKYKRITVSLMVSGDDYNDTELRRIYDPVFIHNLREQEEVLKRMIESSINNIEGIGGWAVNFIQIPRGDNNFLVDVYLDNPNDFIAVVIEIKTAVKNTNYKFDYYRRGFIKDLVSSLYSENK